MQVRRLASAAAELGALYIRSTLRELHAESREEANRMLEGCLALLEAQKPRPVRAEVMNAWQSHVHAFTNLKGDRLAGNVTHGASINDYLQTMNGLQFYILLSTSGKS